MRRPPRGWGATAWTGVEQTAITDRALAEGWDFLLFVTLDKTSVVPKWLPDTKIRLSLPDYGIDQAVGAVKARVEQIGGTLRKPDAITLARIAAERLQRRENSEQVLERSGYEAARQECATVITEISRLASRVTTDAPGLKLRAGTTADMAVLTTNGASMSVYGYFTQPVRKSKIAARLLLGRLLLPQETGLRLSRDPEDYKELAFYFDRRPDLGWCWVAEGDGSCLPALAVADRLVSVFVDFAERVATGELRRSDEDYDD